LRCDKAGKTFLGISITPFGAAPLRQDIVTPQKQAGQGKVRLSHFRC
jgi:hypothetical protein